MMGVFVQVNTESRQASTRPVGYVIQESGCWDWVGSTTRLYGRIYDRATGKRVYAHRWIYERLMRPIPDGMQCHHICQNKACVNPDHLTIVDDKGHFAVDPEKQKSLAKAAVFSRLAIMGKTHCPHGHPYSGSNLYVNPTNGARICKACRNTGKKRRAALRGAGGIVPSGIQGPRGSACCSPLNEAAKP